MATMDPRERAPASGKPVLDHLVLEQALPGHRAAFLVEVRSPQERRRLEQVFRVVEEMPDVDVVPLALGRVNAYALRVGTEPELFDKLESVIGSRFFFSVVERCFTAQTHRLIAHLCLESDSQLVSVPHCAVCDAVDPFPSRVRLFDGANRSLGAAEFCVKCSERFADGDPRRFALNLISRARERFSGLPSVSMIGELERSEAGVRSREADLETWDGNQRIIAIAV